MGIVDSNVRLAALVLSFFLPELSDRYKREVETFRLHLISIQKSSGLPYTVQYVKDSRLAVLRTVSGRPLEEVGRVGLEGG